MIQIDHPEKSELLDMAKSELLNQGFYCRIQVQGNSMWPLIKSNEHVILEGYINSNPKKYDIVAFEKNNKLFLHRIIKIIDQNHIITKGDHLIHPDKSITFENIIGKVIVIERKNNKKLELKKRNWHLINILFANLSLLYSRLRGIKLFNPGVL